jgi:hypothetical protein
MLWELVVRYEDAQTAKTASARTGRLAQSPAPLDVRNEVI